MHRGEDCPFSDSGSCHRDGRIERQVGKFGSFANALDLSVRLDETEITDKTGRIDQFRSFPAPFDQRTFDHPPIFCGQSLRIEFNAEALSGEQAHILEQSAQVICSIRALTIFPDMDFIKNRSELGLPQISRARQQDRLALHG